MPAERRGPRGSPRTTDPRTGARMLVAAGILVGLAVGAGLALAAVAFRSGSKLGAARRMRQQILGDARREAEALRREAQIEAREQAVRLRAELEEELSGRRAQVVKSEQGLSDRETHTKQLQEELKHARDEELKELERISGMTVGEAKAHLLERSEDLVRHELARRVRQLEEEARGEAKRKARNLVADAIKRVAASHAAETTVSIVELPSDDMKGRIIGREGRNIRALEHLTGVDFIIDDTPNAVVLSAFDGVRREIARVTLEKLLQDGRIHPARIEETFYQAKSELETHIVEAGEQAVFEAGVQGLDPELTRILGRLKFRTSYGQNVLAHSVECAQLAAMMAHELGASAKTARRAALLHDIGKAVSHEIEGPHALVGGDLARRYKESEAVAHAMEAHHNEVEPQTVEAVIVQASDALSGARPGARGESRAVEYAK